MPSQTNEKMKFLKINLDKVKYRVLNKDSDFVMVVEGGEGIGKSTLAISICVYLKPDFNSNDIIFTLEEFKKRVRKSKKGDVLLIDEGALMLFSRDAMKGDVKELIKLFTAIRQYNLIIVICVPKFHIIDKYIRDHRVKALLKVVLRGRYFVYNKKKIEQIHRHKKYSRWVYPRPLFKESFGKFDGKIWNDYLEKKGKILQENHTTYIGASEYAKKKKVHVQTIYKWIDNGRLIENKHYIKTDTGRNKFIV